MLASVPFRNITAANYQPDSPVGPSPNNSCSNSGENSKASNSGCAGGCCGRGPSSITMFLPERYQMPRCGHLEWLQEQGRPAFAVGEKPGVSLSSIISWSWLHLAHG